MINPNRCFEKQKVVEERVAKSLSLADIQTTLMPEFSSFDYLLAREDDRGNAYLTAIAEFRHRPTTSKSRYQDICLNASKVESINEAAEVLGVEAYFFCMWEEGDVYYINIKSHTYAQEIRRRNPERVNDRPELALYYPVKDFKPLIKFK